MCFLYIKIGNFKTIAIPTSQKGNKSFLRREGVRAGIELGSQAAGGSQVRLHSYSRAAN